MTKGNVYAIIIGVGDYREMKTGNLPTYRMDLAMIGTALEKGLDILPDSIRIVAGEEKSGLVSVKHLAYAVADVKLRVGSEDTIIVYFSGHCKDGNMIFSDGQISLQSVIDYFDQLQVRSKLIILDCCYSGDFTGAGAREMHFHEAMSDFAGKGIAVLASSSADEVSRLGPGGTLSMFTGALSTSIIEVASKGKEKISLDEIYEETMYLVQAWNARNPGKEQQPIFRSSMGGTIFFTLRHFLRSDEDAIKTAGVIRIPVQMKGCTVEKVKSLSTGAMKRLAISIILPKDSSNEERSVYLSGLLPGLTKEVVEAFRYTEPKAGEDDTVLRTLIPAKAIWCYYGFDAQDLLNGLYAAHTIWGDNEEIRCRFFPAGKPVKDDVCIVENTSYAMLKKLQEPTMTRDEYIERHRKLLALIVSLAEQFVQDLQEVRNRTTDLQTMRKKYGYWIETVNRSYIALSDGDIPPEDLNAWTGEIMNLAGWVLDLSILIDREPDDGKFGEREEWLMKHAVHKYHESMEKLKELEKNIDQGEAP